MRSKSITVAMACLVLVAAVAPAAAADGSLSVGVDQDDGGGATVTVTHNDTTVENASVAVNATDENATYAGEGSYTTDGNGTVDLPAPEENVTVEVVAEFNNTTAVTTAELAVADEGTETGTFGARVSAYVHELLDGAEDREQIGRTVADWVVANNPGNAPDHAGPAEDRGPPSVTGASGHGPNETTGNSSVAAGASGGHPGNGNGPPEDRGHNGK